MEFDTPVKVWPTLEEVVKMKTWGEDEITVLVANLDELDEKTRARLGA